MDRGAHLSVELKLFGDDRPHRALGEPNRFKRKRVVYLKTNTRPGLVANARDKLNKSTKFAATTVKALNETAGHNPLNVQLIACERPFDKAH